MQTLLIALGVGLGFIVAYHTYGRWLARKIFDVADHRICPSHRLRDGQDYVPTPRFVVFGHHFTSIAATGPIVGPAIAVIWGWLPAVLWVLFGSIFMGIVHDFGSLVISLRNNGQTIGEIAGRVLNKRVRLLFLFILFFALVIIIAIFGLVIAAVFRQYPAAIFPCFIQLPIAVTLGLWLRRHGMSLTIPSIIALALMYLSVIYGDVGWLGTINHWMAARPTIEWVILLLAYCYAASVLPVWLLLQPRDYINALQLISALGLVVIGLVAAAFFMGSPAVEGATRQPLEVVAPVFQMAPAGAPPLFPFLFITIACGAISGFHCLVSSGTSSKQLMKESDAQFVGSGSMMTEGFLATLVILACVAGIGLSTKLPVKMDATTTVMAGPAVNGGAAQRMEIRMEGSQYAVVDPAKESAVAYQPLPVDQPRYHAEAGLWMPAVDPAAVASAGVVTAAVVGPTAWHTRYASWGSANGLGRTVGAFVDGSANFLTVLGIPLSVAVAMMGVFVASFAATTLDSATRLQRYVIQEIATTLAPPPSTDGQAQKGVTWLSPVGCLRNPYVATFAAVVTAASLALLPAPTATAWTWTTAGGGGMILWPMFGAMNQLLAGLAFLVITFWLWRRGKPVFFVVFPLCFMLLMPAWAMLHQMFIADAGGRGWLFQEKPNWPLIVMAVVTLTLEAWMIVEALLLWPRVKGLLEPQLPGADGEAVSTQVATPQG